MLRYGPLLAAPQVPIISNPEPCYNQNYDEFSQTLPSFQQQILCCENIGGLHATFECQPMNQNFHHSNSSSFDQFQPSLFPVIHQTPQEMRMEALQAREDLMKSLQNFLKKFNRISLRETTGSFKKSKLGTNFFEVKHAQPEDVQELLNKLLQDWQKTESDELIKSSDENLVPIPSESEDFSDIECECGVPDCDDSQTTNFSTFSNPLFDDSTSSDDESSHEEVIDEMSFKTYSYDEEIISRGSEVRRTNQAVRRYVADPDNAYPKRSITKLILKGAVTFDVVSYQFRCALNYSKLIKKEKSGENWEYCQTEMEANTWNRTQQGVSYEDSVDPHGFEGYLKDGGGVLKLKNFKKDATLKLSKSTNQERYEHVGPEVASSQDGKVSRWRKEIVLG
ncbi:hypothetical protein Tco_0483615 [Tanacetum coccineum]